MRRIFLTVLGGSFGLVLALILCTPTVPDDWAFRAVVISESPQSPGQARSPARSQARSPVSLEGEVGDGADPASLSRSTAALCSGTGPSLPVPRRSLGSTNAPTVEASSAPATTAADLAARLRERVRIPTSGINWLERRLPIRTISAHYRVHTDVSRGAAEETAAVLEQLRARLIDRFGPAEPGTLDGRFQVFVYSDRDVYTRGPAESEVAWPLGRWGFFDGRGNAHLLVLDDARAYLTLLSHEVAHQYQHAALGGSGPRWFKEGIAHAFEWRPAEDLAVPPWPPSSEGTDALATGSLGTLAMLYASDPGIGVDEAMILRFLRDADAGLYSLERALAAEAQSGAVLEASERALGYVLIKYLRDAREHAFRPWYVEFERQVSAGGAVPPWPESAPTPRELLQEIRSFAVRCRPATQVHFDLRWSDGRRTSERVEGEVVTWPLGSVEGSATPSRVAFTLDRLFGDERVGLAVLRDDGARETTWWIDHEGATLTTDDADGSRDVSMGVRVMLPFRMEFRLGATSGVRVLRSGMKMLDAPSFRLGEGRRLAIAFAAADDSAFHSTVALHDLECAGLDEAGGRRAEVEGSGPVDRALEETLEQDLEEGLKDEKKRSPDSGL